MQTLYRTGLRGMNLHANDLLTFRTIGRHSFPMRLLVLAGGLAFFVTLQTALVATQSGAEPGDPMRIVILVDNSEVMADALPILRRGLQQFLSALPRNHELMLVTTGGHLNIRVEPTRDYLTVSQSFYEIQLMRSSGNALIGSVEEIYARYLRNVERRYPILVIIAIDGPDMSQRFTKEGLNKLMQDMTDSGVRVNALLLNPAGYRGVVGSSLVHDFTMAMIKRTGGAYESAASGTSPAKLKTLAGRIAQQYKQLSPDQVPTGEFRR